MEVLDFINLGKQRVSFYLALEDYLLKITNKEFFFLWDIEPSMVIGRHQLLEAEVNMDFVLKNNLFVYRRPSGGGTIYADEGCFMFTFVNRAKNKTEVFKKLEIIVEAFKSLGLAVSFSGRNDLLFKKKKFSGNSYFQNEFGSVLHGTILYDTNLEDLVKSITTDNQKLISKGIKSVRERVINLKEYLNISKYELMDYLNNYVSKDKFELEEEAIKEIILLEKKYLSDDWLVGNCPPYIYRNKARFSYGSLEVFVDVYKEKIKSLSLKGDFISVDEIEEFLDKFKGIEFTEDGVLKVLRNTNIASYIMDAKAEDLISLLF